MRFQFIVLAIVALLPAQAQKLPVASRQLDLDYITMQVPRLHPNFFYRLDERAFQAAAARLNANIANLTDAEFLVQLTALISMAGDAHTTIYPTGAAAARLGFQTLPLQFRWLDDGVFVVAASSQYSRAAGARLVKIGDVPIDRVMERMAAIIPHDNDGWLHYMAQPYLAGQQILEGLNLVPPAPATSLTFRTLAGDEFTLNVAPSTDTLQSAIAPSAGTVPDYLVNPVSNYWYRYVPDQRLGYLKYNLCRDDPAHPFTAFSDAVLNSIDVSPIDTLVIDFRGNTGGASALFKPIGQGLSARWPVIATPKFRIYVLIDKGTFSSGMQDAMAFQTTDQTARVQSIGFTANINLKNFVVTIGEPTGGKPSAYGNVQPFTLPGSGLAGQYSTRYFDTMAGVPDAPSFNPDIPVNIRSTDYFARFDPVMAAVRARSNGAPAEPSGTAIAVNGASFRPDHGVAAGSFAAIFGSFAMTPDQVLIDGAISTIVSAAQSQVNVVVPASVAAGRRTVSVRAAGAELAAGQVTITPTGPGIFVLNPGDPSQPGAVENQDSTINGPAAPAAKASVIQIFATGYGTLDPSGAAPVQVFAGELPAHVLYSAPVPQFPGLWQINAQLPANVSGTVPVYLIAGGMPSNAVTVRVQ